jgi:hypothetical protein
MRIHFLDTSNTDLLAETKSLVRSSDDLEVKILYASTRSAGVASTRQMGYGSTTDGAKNQMHEDVVKHAARPSPPPWTKCEALPYAFASTHRF